MSHPWPMVPLGDVLTERRETPDLGDLVTGRVRVVGKVGFNDGKIRLRADGETKTGMILIRPGDLVVSGINAAKGAIAIYGVENTQDAAATIHYGAYVPNKDCVEVRYLWWLLRSSTFRELLSEHLPGGIKTELKATRLLKVPIPLAPLQDQRRIVAQIEHLAEKVAVARELRDQSKAICKQQMEATIQDVMARYKNLGKFGEVITFKPRSGPSFVTDPDWKGMPVLMPSSVTGFGVDTGRVEFGPGNERVSPKDLLQPGDILIARGNKRDQVGNAGVVPEPAKGWVCANLLMRLQLDRARVEPPFCIYWLRSPLMRDHVKRSMTGTNPNIQKINQAIIVKYSFPVEATLEEQQRIVAYLDDLQAKINSLRRLQDEAAAELNAMLPAILDRAFRGEL